MDTTPSLGSATKELKVKIPVGHHVTLHSVKVLTGRPIGDTVRLALDAYFSAQAAETLGFRT